MNNLYIKKVMSLPIQMLVIWKYNMDYHYDLDVPVT